MSLTTEQRLGRLRDFYLGVRGPYDGIADDIGFALDNIGSLKAAIELGQQNCDAVYEDLRAERTAAQAACKRAYAFFSAGLDEAAFGPDEKRIQATVIIELRALLIGAGIK